MCAVKWQWMKDELQKLAVHSQKRTLVDSRPSRPGWILRDNREMLNLASNHYLGLSQTWDIEQVENTLRHWGICREVFRTGSTASRFIVGNDPIFREFEQAFAAYKQTESTLVFSNGYLANLGIISSLMGRGDHIFSDRLNHASIVDGIVLSRAHHHRYGHRDVEQLAWMLAKVPPSSKKLIITDALFSMDGTFAPLKEIVELKHRYGAMLMVDEAHSGGVYGEHGTGYTRLLGLTNEVDIQMGTFSKAYGCYGAYLAADQVVIDYVINKARSLIYTTALPPMLIAVLMHQWQQVQKSEQSRAHLHSLARYFREQLRIRGLQIGPSESQIVPVFLGSNERTVAFANQLQARGIAGVAIRPPTVPDGTGRIRFSITADLEQTDIDWAVEQISQVSEDCLSTSP